MSRAGGLSLVVVLAAVAFVARTAIVAATRTRWPTFAETVNRWWAWAPLFALCVWAIWVSPVIGVVVTVVMVVAMSRSDALGSPFRPRR